MNKTRKVLVAAVLLVFVGNLCLAQTQLPISPVAKQVSSKSRQVHMEERSKEDVAVEKQKQLIQKVAVKATAQIVEPRKKTESVIAPATNMDIPTESPNH